MSNLKSNLILIGFMGSGKSTLGKWISNKENMTFYDTDEYIEQRERRKIKDIFASDGELFFRDLETKAIQEMCDKLTNSVISVGGGLPIRPENQSLLQKLGIVVYLRTKEDTLIRRLQNDNTRPLLMGSDISEKIHSLMLQRESIYMGASDIIVDTDNQSFQQVYGEIRKQLEQCT